MFLELAGAATVEITRGFLLCDHVYRAHTEHRLLWKWAGGKLGVCSTATRSRGRRLESALRGRAGANDTRSRLSVGRPVSASRLLSVTARVLPLLLPVSCTCSRAACFTDNPTLLTYCKDVGNKHSHELVSGYGPFLLMFGIRVHIELPDAASSYSACPFHANMTLTKTSITLSPPCAYHGSG